jgi:integrase/recombinase XerD
MTTPNAGSPLRQRMIDDMVARQLALGTQRGHVFACKQFAAYLGRSPETATPDVCATSSGISSTAAGAFTTATAS